jgi:hypothetical protein
MEVSCERLSLGRQAAIGGVRSDLAVGEPPALEQASIAVEIFAYLIVQQLVTQPADEDLDKGVLLELAGRDVVPVEAGAGGPHQNGA